ncbi:hypothetical protein M2360_001988 [Rhizobium sp. SG_E_25_P2]|uniref:hypothetical protein n=1 Tax=Rhizobium sp. SG_E_25_P2 TaxID=2879942 RepID=UPI00247523ED|nr:hypothetical protein [Rhizobium sp. SG_E_25_P2]MDH6266592.1 hypothetical protein [Rhizobium sp. SG_E_25_P2]
MLEISLDRAWAIYKRAWPFLLLRLAAGLTAALASLSGLILGAWLLESLAGRGGIFGAWGGLMGLWGAAFLISRLRWRVRLAVGLPHAAAFNEGLQNSPLAQGEDQVAEAQALVAERFSGPVLLSDMDPHIRAAAGAVPGLIGGARLFITMRGLDGLAAVLTWLISLAMTPAVDLVYAYVVHLRAANPWQAARQGLVLYGQNSRRLIVNGMAAAAMIWSATLLMLLILAPPMGGLFAAFPDSVSNWSLLGAVLFAWAIKSAFFDPFALAALTPIFFRLAESQTPDPEWDRALSEMSPAFRRIRNRAAGWNFEAAAFGETRG